MKKWGLTKTSSVRWNTVCPPLRVWESVLIIIAIAAVVLVGVMLLLIFLPKAGDDADPTASVRVILYHSPL